MYTTSVSVVLDLIYPNHEPLPDYVLAVSDYLNQSFPRYCLERKDSIEWPPHSINLTPIYFFLGGVLKNKF